MTNPDPAIYLTELKQYLEIPLWFALGRPKWM